MHPDELIRIVRLAIKNRPFESPEIKQVLMNANVGSPLGVYTSRGELSYWLVPLLLGEKACGFASLDLKGKVMRMGVFGGTLNEKNRWIDKDYFESPPLWQLNELKKKYPGYSLSEPLFSFDGSPVRFAWLIKVESENENIFYAFFSPGGWYEKQTLIEPGDTE